MNSKLRNEPRPKPKIKMNTTYEIIIRTTQIHESCMCGAGMSQAFPPLRYDGEKFREGAFDVETWEDETKARRAFENLSSGNDFAPGQEMVLIREVYDEKEDDYTRAEIAIKKLAYEE
jgi:hypothetical protein